MFRVPTTWVMIVFLSVVSVCANAAQRPSAGVSAASAAAQPKTQPPSQDSLSDDAAAARQLLDLANQARIQAGVPPLQMDHTLNQAASRHTLQMAVQQQLSYQFSGEPSLMQRLTAGTDLYLDQAGESIGFAPTVDQAHEAIMQTAVSRKNLLNPAFDLAGFSVVRNAGLLYITEDFGHGERSQPAEQADDAVVQAVAEARTQAGVGSLRKTSMAAARTAACSMAQAGSLNGPQLSGYHVVRYSAFSPSQLPPGAASAVVGNDVRELSVGTCYGQTSSNTQGMLYVVLVLK